MDENGLLYRHRHNTDNKLPDIELMQYGLDESIQQITIKEQYTIAITSKGIYENRFVESDPSLKTWSLIEEFCPIFNEFNHLNNLINRLKMLELKNQEEKGAFKTIKLF